MIVKNEAHVIERCLAAARPHFDAWAIVDTGSTDATIAAIGRATKGWKGTLGHVKWTGFGDARTESLRLAKETGCDYAFVLDADEIVSVFGGWPEDGKDIYNITMSMGGIEWPQSRLFRLACNWYYEGVIHEAPMSHEAKLGGHAQNIKISSPRDGARSQNPNKYRDDALVLEAEFAKKPESTRLAFYVGQSWRDAKNDEKALEWYEKRVAMGSGGNVNEWFTSMLEVARAKHRLKRPPHEVRSAYLRAHALNTTRAEPLYGLATLCREHNDFALGWHFANIAASLPMPEGLFIDTRIYRWLAKDELSIALAHLGRPDVAKQLAEEILATPGLPEAEHARISANIQAYEAVPVPQVAA